MGWVRRKFCSGFSISDRSISIGFCYFSGGADWIGGVGAAVIGSSSNICAGLTQFSLGFDATEYVAGVACPELSLGKV